MIAKYNKIYAYITLQGSVSKLSHCVPMLRYDFVSISDLLAHSGWQTIPSPKPTPGFFCRRWTSATNMQIYSQNVAVAALIRSRIVLLNEQFKLTRYRSCTPRCYSLCLPDFTFSALIFSILHITSTMPILRETYIKVFPRRSDALRFSCPPPKSYEEPSSHHTTALSLRLSIPPRARAAAGDSDGNRPCWLYLPPSSTFPIPPLAYPSVPTDKAISLSAYICWLSGRKTSPQSKQTGNRGKCTAIAHGSLGLRSYRHGRSTHTLLQASPHSRKPATLGIVINWGLAHAHSETTTRRKHAAATVCRLSLLLLVASWKLQHEHLLYF